MSRLQIRPATARKLWRGIMGGTAVYTGFGYLFGPPVWYQTPSLELVRQFVVPVPVWGAVMMLAGFMIFTRWRDYGHWIAMVLWAFWFACIATVAGVSLIAWVMHLNIHGIPPIQGWGAPSYVLVYMMVHAHMVLGPPEQPVFYMTPDYEETDAEPT